MKAVQFARFRRRGCLGIRRSSAAITSYEWATRDSRAKI